MIIRILYLEENEHTYEDEENKRIASNKTVIESNQKPIPTFILSKHFGQIASNRAFGPTLGKIQIAIYFSFVVHVARFLYSTYLTFENKNFNKISIKCQKQADYFFHMQPSENNTVI